MRAILMMMILVAAAIAAPAWAESDLDATLARIGAKADLALMTMQSRPRAAAAPVAEKAKEGGATPTAGAAETPPAAGKTAPAEPSGLRMIPTFALRETRNDHSDVELGGRGDSCAHQRRFGERDGSGDRRRCETGDAVSSGSGPVGKIGR